VLLVPPSISGFETISRKGVGGIGLSVPFIKGKGKIVSLEGHSPSKTPSLPPPTESRRGGIRG